MGEPAHAMRDMNIAIGLKIKILDPFLRLIRHHMQRHQFLPALIITDQLITNMPEIAAGAYYDKGQIFELMGKADLAILALNVA